MKRTILTLLSIPVLAMSLAAAPAMADDRDHHDRGRHGHDDRHDRHDNRRDDRRDGYRRPVVVERNYYRPGPPPRVYRPYGYERGYRYNNYYGGRTYVINDYDRYHVRHPPRGYHWVRDDRGNLIMVAIATGIITDLLLNH
ncbi:RcnB family protein [Pseudoxanthomonas sp.]|uniref:RcnB family protein n=1 Tax=Pseudoxanthomonas sp. TaxID=1871049 RepID=UPI00260F9E5F|nr:RcnB family protein [Pseudoxanthomonas sp.]WDS35688.1 MAG: RcnB family protein [Pseudoxanthomonas sp.]